jgi:hypothetical protein
VTLRSLMIGDCDHYVSPYMIGVAQACDRLRIEHRQISIRSPLAKLARAIDDHRPDVLWTHMLLWAPEGSPPVGALVDLMQRAAKNGARVVIHDGDYKERTRHPHDLSAWCALALCNHGFDRSAWRVPVVHWPYFAFAQDRIVEPDPRWACGLWFAGMGPVYAERTALLGDLTKLGVGLRVPKPADGNTLLKTEVIAASADAVLGFGRPGVKGWVDTRVFQYPGAGAILLHDDAGGYLEPGEHYIPYESGSADSIAEALERLRAMPETERRALRERAFAFVQERHSSVARVRQVLDVLEMG